jgi:hypothetical protein
MLFVTDYKRLNIFILFMMISWSFPAGSSASENADRMASEFRGMEAGAEYTAMGKSGCALIDDIFSVYWNPAGLGILARYLNFSNVKDDKRPGTSNDGQITDNDLTGFSADGDKTAQTGASGSFIYDKSAAGFLGSAFKVFGGAIAAAVISSYNEDNSTEVSASAGYLSYGRSFGPAELGMSLKAFHGKAGDSKFYGFGADAGCRLEVVPFLTLAIVVQDLAAAFKPYSDYGNMENKYDFAVPAYKFSAAMSSIPKMVIAFTGINAPESGFEFNYGIRYDIIKRLSVSLGLNDYYAVCTGFTGGFSFGKLSYAFSCNIDGKDYLNIISFIYEI